MKKILIIRLGAIGDVIHSTIIPQSIKNKYSEIECHFLTSDFIAPLLENSPYIDKILKFNNKKKDNLFYLLTLGLKLRKEKYDIIINLTNSSRNIFLSFLANSKKIVKRSKIGSHAVEAFFNSGLQIYPDLIIPKSLKLYLSKNLNDLMGPKLESYKRPFIVISPGGHNDNLRQGRIWPIENWIELGIELQKKYKGTIFVIGSKAEQKIHENCKKIPNCVIFTGLLALEESAFLFSLADLFISGDSGPLHITSALNTKAIGLMGSTNTAPYGDNGYTIEPKIECKYCDKKKCIKLNKNEIYTPCMKSIETQDILSLIEKEKLL